jgi:serine/threonine protein kinase
MRMLRSSMIWSVGLLTSLRADVCQDFCVAKLGSPAACGKSGSFCKGSDRVCHGLFWRDAVTICYHDGVDRTCSSRLLPSVKCSEAELFMSSGLVPDVISSSSTTRAPTTEPTTTFTPFTRPQMPIAGDRKENYARVSLLGSGSTGEVYLARRHSDGAEVALKIARKDAAAERELQAYRSVRDLDGFPQLFSSFADSTYNYLVLSRVGPAISSYRQIGGGRSRRLPDATVGSIALQMIDRLEDLHSRGFVHLDMYPNNIALGNGRERNKLYLIDFGEARPIGGEFNRRMDLRSLSHTVLQLFQPGTPYGDFKHWDGERPRVPLEEVCRGLPPALLLLFRYTHATMGPDDEPDYDLVRDLMLSLAPEYSGSLILE